MVPLFSRFVVNYRWPWLSSHAASQQNPLCRDRQEKNQPIENQIRRGYPGNAFAHFTKKWREKHRFPVEGILNVRRVYEVCILNSCLLTFFKPFYRSYVKSYKTIQVHIIWLPVGCCESGTPMVYGETVVNWNCRRRCTFSVSLAWNFRGTNQKWPIKIKTKTNGDLARFPGRRWLRRLMDVQLIGSFACLRVLWLAGEIMFGFVVFPRFSRLPLASRHDWFIWWSAFVVICQFIFQIWCWV